MTTTNDLQNMEGRTAVDSEGSKVGKIGQVYLDDQTGQPLWVTVTTGMFGARQVSRRSTAPGSNGDQVMLAVSKDLIKDAPSIDDDGQIDASEQDALYQHYSGYLGGSTRARPRSGHAATPRGRARPDGIQGRDTSGPIADDAMTRSEERLRVGTENAEVGRARLRKHVVTENVTQTVPVSHEEVRLEREPVTDANREPGHLRR